MSNEIDLSRVRVCKERCKSCIFSPDSPISSERRKEYERMWKKADRFQNCHYGTHVGDKALMCRGFYDWCKATGWEPPTITVGERMGRLIFVDIPYDQEEN